jgi:hypothetical protein
MKRLGVNPRVRHGQELSRRAVMIVFSQIAGDGMVSGAIQESFAFTVWLSRILEIALRSRASEMSNGATRVLEEFEWGVAQIHDGLRCGSGQFCFSLPCP